MREELGLVRGHVDVHRAVALAPLAREAKVQRLLANAGWPSILAALATLLAILFLPIQLAVGIGVVLAAVLHLSQSASDVSVVELVHHENGTVEERRAPNRLEPRSVTVVDVYGHLFYAGARTLERQLPTPDAEQAALALRLHGRTNLGATLVDVLANYAKELEKGGGRLYLAGTSAHVHRQIERSGKLRLNGDIRVFPATSILGQATQRAVEDARQWIASLSDDENDQGE